LESVSYHDDPISTVLYDAEAARVLEFTSLRRDTATPVSSDYTRNTSVFNGKVNWVQIDLGTDTHDHFISPEDRLNLAMARQ
jgi:hypothetical protein